MSAAWHDKPTEPGLWLRVFINSGLVGCPIIVTDMNYIYWVKGLRHYGPIPPDNASGVGE